jgi:hypothetical protein
MPHIDSRISNLTVTIIIKDFNKIAEGLLRNISEGSNLSEDELLRLRGMFRESLTFD